MPAELMDRPLVIAPSASSAEIKSGGSEWREKEGITVLEDEYSPREIPILKPLGANQAEHSSPLAERFEYYSKTRELEYGTERTEILEGIVSKMTAGENIPTRVVIMNKGGLAAFVHADGSIFITQSLLNQLDTLDQVAAVLGHELGHLTHQSHQRISVARDPATRFGVEALHERVSDVESRLRMEKAGFNTLEFSSMISLIQGLETDPTHGSGFSRSAFNFGSHYLLDSRTAHLELTPIPDTLHQDFKNTNLQVVSDLLKDASTEAITSIINKLHPYDLGEIYETLWKDRSRHPDRTAVIHNLILSRLEEAGYSKLDSMMMLVLDGLTWPNIFRKGTGILNDLDVMQHAVDRLSEFEKEDLVDKMHRQIFASGVRGDSPVIEFLSFLRFHMYDENKTKKGNKVGVPVTKDSLLSHLEKISQLSIDHNISKEKGISDVILEYFEIAYLLRDEPGKEMLEVEGIREFLVQVKERNIAFDHSHLRGELTVAPSKRSYLDPDGFKQSTLRIYGEVFNEKVESDFGFQDIDDYFDKLYKDPEGTTHGSFLNLINILYGHFADYELGDAERVKFLEYLDERIDQLKFSTEHNLWEFLSGAEKGSTLDNKDLLESIKPDFLKFQTKVILGRSIFKEDGDEFYQYMEKVIGSFYETMQRAGIQPNSLSKIQLINLCQGLLTEASHSNLNELYDLRNGEWLNPALAYVRNTSRLFDLPFVKDLANKEEKVEAENIVELDEYIRKFFEKIQSKNSIFSFSLYRDTPMNLVIGPAISRKFNEIVQQGITVQEFHQLFIFINRHFPEGIQRDEILRSLNKQYLSSPEVSFNSKVVHLKLSLKNIGYEGVLMVAEDIKDINTYRKFKADMGNYLEQYLDGSVIITKVAAADALGTRFVKNFRKLLQTTGDDHESKKSVSTESAIEWVEDVFSGIEFDQASSKFVVDQSKRGLFRSLSDIFSQLQNFTPIQRFAVAQKALLEKGGALSTEQNREQLATTLIDAVKLKEGFITNVLRTTLRIGSTDYIGFPASNMLAGLLFRAFDIKSVDLDRVQDLAGGSRQINGQQVAINEIFASADLQSILNSYTRDILLFGAAIRKDPNSRIAQIAQESDDLYYQTVDIFRNLLGPGQETKSERTDGSQIDAASEAIIRAVESSGALGIRALQLATQFHSFSPAVGKRLSETFDSYKSMDRLWFFENLDKLVRDEPNGVEVKQLEEFLQRIKVGSFLGGGSLQTTYGATLHSEDGVDHPIIIKRKNPSVAGLLKIAYGTSKDVLDEVSKSTDKETQDYARLGRVLVDLSQKWCFDDLGDTHYEPDDDLFRTSIASYNKSLGRNAFYAPERVFTQKAVKSETLAKGDTVNRILGDDKVPMKVKKRLVTMLGQFFAYQMKGRTFKDDDGKDFRLIHSDPHVGNYVADIEDPEQPRMAVIDRSMYLKLAEKEAKVLGKLVDGSNPNDFIYSFIDLVLDENKDINRMERLKITARVFKNVAAEFMAQMVAGKVNKFLLLTPLLKDLSDQGKDIPLRVRLMIRNIAALQELSKRYGVDFEALYKETA